MTEAEWLACEDITKLSDGRGSWRTGLHWSETDWKGRTEWMTRSTRKQLLFALACLREFPSGFTGRCAHAISLLAGTECVVCDSTERHHAALFRDIFGNPFRSVTFSAAWRTDTVLALSRQMYDARNFSAMSILADALQDAGCGKDDILAHCHNEGPHVRGCWVVDLVLGKK